MPPSLPPRNNFFIPFNESIEHFALPDTFTDPFNYKPHPISLLASRELQDYLSEQKEWEHNFGLNDSSEGRIIGKMFGVLVVRTAQHEVGYLAAFSGKLAGGYHHAKFVPPVYDALKEGSFLNIGMQELTQISKQIKELQEELADNKEMIGALQQLRKTTSVALQAKLFDQYHFLNQAGQEKSLRTIFQKQFNNNPPAGAGECAAPKLLHYAFRHQMQPLALAEFWWGQSPKSATWKHSHFYPSCQEKCAPILAHMLEDMVTDLQPT
ncbi:pseudouridylate synthase [Pontibacter burrus]|uniref:pseudouridylate synthase n=1 Tax=Pontibacter burrus TaxID=2704466 RepID=UPI0019546F41|nr:pseudouridylate synthase [Pontibacter burrus]